MEKTKPQITSSEVQEWENKFKQEVSPMVQFSPGENQNNSLRLYNGVSGIEAEWAGTIILGADNYIKWTFSVQNGPFSEMKINLTQENYDIITRLFNFYDVWKNTWATQLSIPGSNMDDTQNLSGANPSPAGPAQATPDETSIQENKRTKMYIIENNKERMQKLSGLL